MSLKPGDKLTIPVTVYAVALVYKHKAENGLIATASHIETVSGQYPLTADKVKGRADAATRANWGAIFTGIRSEEYVLALWHYRGVWFGPNGG